MSREYSPDRWVLLEMDGKIRKVLGGWSGGYLDSDNWRLSSGVESVEEDGDYYLFKNYSGSVYKCHKNSEGFTALSSRIYAGFLEKIKDTDHTIEIIDMDESNESGSTETDNNDV